MNLRRRGISTLFIHHAGKGGQQRGASKREDVLDTVIYLERPGDYNASEGARFIVQYEKNRHFHGDDAKPFEALLMASPAGTQAWTFKDLEQSRMERVVAMLKEGMSQKDIAAELKVSKGTVSKDKDKAVKQGLFADEDSEF